MRKSKLQAAHLEGDADDIEAAFYDALQRGDIDKLMACWADEDDIFCIHPGGPGVVGAGSAGSTTRAASTSASMAVPFRPGTSDGGPVAVRGAPRPEGR